MMSRPGRCVGVLGTLAAGLAVGCQGDSCGPTEPGCGGPLTYVVQLSGAPADIGAVIVSLATEEHADVVVRSGRALPASLSGIGTRVAVLASVSAGTALLEVTFANRPETAPQVSVLQASANQSDGYALIPPSTLGVQVGEASVQ